MLRPNRSKNREPSTEKKQAESFEISFYIGGFEPGLEYQRVLVLDVDSRATHLLQEEAFFKSWEKPKTRKAGAVQNFLQNNPATANFLLINTKTPKFSLIRTETVCGQKSDWKIGAGSRRIGWLVGGLVAVSFLDLPFLQTLQYPPFYRIFQRSSLYIRTEHIHEKDYSDVSFYGLCTWVGGWILVESTERPRSASVEGPVNSGMKWEGEFK